MSQSCDVVIVGGGFVGGTLACALGQSGIATVVVEAAAPDTRERPGHDDRGLALSLCSQRILEGLGIWTQLAAGAAPIERIHVSEAGSFGAVRLSAADIDAPVLGYVVRARDLGAAILAAQQGHASLRWLAPAEVAGLIIGREAVDVEVKSASEASSLRAQVVIAADGTDSALRGLLGVKTTSDSYGQTAIVATVSTARRHYGTAYECFTGSGPIALLPTVGERSTVVWTVDDDAAPEVLRADDTHFIAGLLARFGHRLGRISAPGPRRGYRFSRVLATPMTGHRFAVIGNAAHTLHANGAQGFNLGLRDVAALAEALVDAVRAGRDPGAAPVLAAYEAGRTADVGRVSSLTHALARAFAVQFPPLRLARSLGFVAIERIPALKRSLVRQGTGLYAARSRLARGLPL